MVDAQAEGRSRLRRVGLRHLCRLADHRGVAGVRHRGAQRDRPDAVDGTVVTVLEPADRRGRSPVRSRPARCGEQVAVRRAHGDIALAGPTLVRVVSASPCNRWSSVVSSGVPLAGLVRKSSRCAGSSPSAAAGATARTPTPGSPRSWSSYRFCTPDNPVTSPARSRPAEPLTSSAVAGSTVPSTGRAKSRVGVPGAGLRHSSGVRRRVDAYQPGEAPGTTCCFGGRHLRLVGAQAHHCS